MDRRITTIRSKPFDVRTLHAEILAAGGSDDAVSGRDLKPYIFGKYDDSDDLQDSDKDSDDDSDIYSDDSEDPDYAGRTKETRLDLKKLRLERITAGFVPRVDPEGMYCVSVDGYYTKNGGNGGFGAILREMDGLSVVAHAGASPHSASGFYHTLEGIRAGFNLAINNGVKYFQIVCNADLVAYIVRQCFISNFQGKCATHPRGRFDTFCIPCLKQTKASADFTHNFEIIKEIVGLGKQYYRTALVTSMRRKWNKPADYLAKMVRSPGDETMLTPEEFPDELKSLLKEFDGDLPFHLG